MTPAAIGDYAMLSRARTVAKAGALLLASAYAIGILVYNGYLASVGVADFGLPRAQATLSGLWLMILFAVGAVAEDGIRRAQKMEDVPGWWRALSAAFAFFGAYLFYALVILCCHSGEPARATTLRAVALTPVIMFVSVGSTVMWAESATKEWSRRIADRTGGPVASAFFLGNCVFSFASLVVFASLFVTNVYRFVPQEYGGARPMPARVAVSAQEAAALRALSVRSSGGVLDGPVEVVHETSQDLSVLAPRGLVILPRREVLAVRVGP